MAATTDTWLADSAGGAVLVWSSPPGAALTGELRQAAKAVRDLLGADATPIICFDRGGWSPAGFAEVVAAGFYILTYRKAPLAREPRSAFRSYQVADAFGHKSEYLLADRAVRIYYGRRRHYFVCRQVTRLDGKTGHQTQVLTSRRSLEVTTKMFGRWREENLFRFMRPRGLDAMDSYAKVEDDPTRMVPNPAKARMKKRLASARAAVGAPKQAAFGADDDDDDGPKALAVEQAQVALDSLKADSLKAESTTIRRQGPPR